ncbi:hypothetical protein HPB48_020293 [Haemaphysalis longicornis]|uniref:Uncharacterized protein n=1 Tax=Haemaphysalis longicornis TaxID=44386 RepID=A0A9J6GMD2_HAELO|nr:hypothetical protein HPB48_020293 [Haemaphysalis longicornis]
MLEPEVTVFCRPQDEALLDLDAAARNYHQATGGQTVRLSLEPTLSASTSGGVELQAKRWPHPRLQHARGPPEHDRRAAAAPDPHGPVREEPEPEVQRLGTLHCAWCRCKS